MPPTTLPVKALGRYHTSGDKFATGINMDTLEGYILLSNSGGIFALPSPYAIHVGVDASKNVVNVTDATITSVPFSYANGKARAVVTVSTLPRTGSGGGTGGFKIVNEADGSALVTSGPLPFEPNSGDVVIG